MQCPSRVRERAVMEDVVVVVHLLICVQLFATPQTAALSFTTSQSLLKLVSSEAMMPSNHPILCCLLLLLSLIFHSSRVFFNASALHIRWPKFWSFSFSISPFSEYSGLISLQSKGLSRVLSNTTDQKHQFFGTQPSLRSNSHIHT